MSTKPYKGFEPKWMLQRAPENSYRSIFRWGDPDFFKYPKESLYKYVKKRCNLKDEEFMQYNDDLGLDPVNLGEEHAPKIDKKHVKAIAAIVGEKKRLRPSRRFLRTDNVRSSQNASPSF